MSDDRWHRLLADRLRLSDPAVLSEVRDTLLRHMTEDEALAVLESDPRYKDWSRKGQGGQSVVYAVLDEQVGRQVAYKSLHPGTEADGLQRFLREARITGQLEHQAIVPVHDIGMRADGAFYTMKLVQGDSMSKRLKACKTLADRLDLLDAFEKVCEALAFAHAHRIVHRDLKPENVMISSFGQTYLVDWGLARTLDTAESMGTLQPSDQSGTERLTMVGAILGTPSYMSPEQARAEHERVDTRADVWGLGAILYDILTGRPPYTGSSAIAVVFKNIEGTPIDDVRKLCPGAPGPLVSIVEKALQREPEARYQTVEALLADVRAFRRGDAVSAHRYTPLERMRLRRNLDRMAYGLLFASCVVVVTVFCGLAMWYSQGALERQTQALQSARDSLVEERRITQHTMENLFFDMANQLKDVPGAGRAEETLLLAGRDYYLKHESRAGGTDQDRIVLAGVLIRLSMLAHDLGREADARDALEASEKLLTSLPDANRLEVRRKLAITWQQEGTMASDAGDVVAAADSFTQAMTLTGQLLQQHPDSLPLQRDQACNLLGLGIVSEQEGKQDDAETQFTQAVEKFKGLATTAAARRDLASACLCLGDLQAARGRDAGGAFSIARQAVAGQEKDRQAMAIVADVVLRLGNYEAAWTLASETRRREPGNWDFACLAAYTALAAGHDADTVSAATAYLAARTPSVEQRFFAAVDLMAAEALQGHSRQAYAASVQAMAELDRMRCGASDSLYALRRALESRHADGEVIGLLARLEKARLLGASAPKAMRAAVLAFQRHLKG